MANPSLNELKLTVKFRGIKGYKSMSEDELLGVLEESGSLKENENNFDDTKPKIDFSKSRIKRLEEIFMK